MLQVERSAIIGPVNIIMQRSAHKQHNNNKNNMCHVHLLHFTSHLEEGRGGEGRGGEGRGGKARSLREEKVQGN